MLKYLLESNRIIILGEIALQKSFTELTSMEDFQLPLHFIARTSQNSCKLNPQMLCLKMFSVILTEVCKNNNKNKTKRTKPKKAITDLCVYLTVNGFSVQFQPCCIQQGTEPPSGMTTLHFSILTKIRNLRLYSDESSQMCSPVHNKSGWIAINNVGGVKGLEDWDFQAATSSGPAASASFRTGLSCGLSRKFLWQLVQHENLATRVKTQPCHSLNNSGWAGWCPSDIK